MAHRKDLYRFTAQLAASAVLVFVGPSPAMAAGGVGISVAALAGLHRDRAGAELGTAVAEAERSAIEALRGSVEFTDADFDRALSLLRDDTSAVRPGDYAEAAALSGASNGGADPETLITDQLLGAIGFEPDDGAAKRLLELLLGVQVRTICNHPKMAPAITRAFEIRNARRNEEILSLVRELHATRSTTVPEDTLIAMARKISPRVANRDEALRALDAAADRVAAAMARGEAGSNIDAFVDAALREIASLTAEGRFGEAAGVADRSVEQAEAGLAQCLAAAIDAHLVNLDASGAARQIVRRLQLDLAAGTDMFDAVMDEQAAWYERGRDVPSRLDLEVAVALADQGGRFAADDGQRGEALNTRGVALRVIAERYRSVRHCRDAVAALRAAIDLRPREVMPDDWSMSWMNLGNALSLLGDLTGSDRTLREGVDAYRQALLERDRSRNAVQWARCCYNLHGALIRIGAADRDAASLSESVSVLRDAVASLPVELAPVDHAGARHALGEALWALGELTGDHRHFAEAMEAYTRAILLWRLASMPLVEARSLNELAKASRSTGRFDEAVEAYEAALSRFEAGSAPHQWAEVKNNLGDTLRLIGERDGSDDHLRAAVAAFDDALGSLDRDLSRKDWAIATGNRGLARLSLARSTSDGALAAQARDDLVAAVELLPADVAVTNSGLFAKRLPEARELAERP